MHFCSFVTCKVCGAPEFYDRRRRPRCWVCLTFNRRIACRGGHRRFPLSRLLSEHFEKLNADFLPSRDRFRSGILESSAGAVQRSGDSVPPLIPADCTPETALSLAASVNPFDFSLFANFSAAILRDSSLNIAKPGDAPVFRDRVSEHLVQVDRVLRPLAARWRAALPVGAPNVHLNLVLLSFLLGVFSYSDSNLRADLSAGMRIQGVIPFCPARAPRVAHDTQSRTSIASGLFRRNKRFALPLARPGGTVEALKCWELALSEYKKGWLSRPVIGSQLDLKTRILSPRFCISETHGLSAAKFRLVGDFPRSRVNQITSLSDTYRPQTLDFLLALCRLQASQGGVGLKVWSVDFTNAYKTIPVHRGSADVSGIMLFNPVDGFIRRARVIVQPFGIRSAPKNWGRVITCIQFLPARLFRLNVGAYVDDVFAGEPAAFVESGFHAFKSIASILEFHTADKKDQPPGVSISLLGAVVTAKHDGVIVAPSPERLERNVTLIRSCLDTNTLTPGLAGKLRGKLGFLSSLCFGELTRSMLAPVFSRQYSRGVRSLSSELRTCLRWWETLLPALRPRFIPFRPPLLLALILMRRGLATSLLLFGSDRAL